MNEAHQTRTVRETIGMMPACRVQTIAAREHGRINQRAERA